MVVLAAVVVMVVVVTAVYCDQLAAIVDHAHCNLPPIAVDQSTHEVCREQLGTFLPLLMCCECP